MRFSKVPYVFRLETFSVSCGEDIKHLNRPITSRITFDSVEEYYVYSKKYICMYVRVCVCMYVCMYVCIGIRALLRINLVFFTWKCHHKM